MRLDSSSNFARLFCLISGYLGVSSNLLVELIKEGLTINALSFF
jgi:hypothetical protein